MLVVQPTPNFPILMLKQLGGSQVWLNDAYNRYTGYVFLIWISCDSGKAKIKDLETDQQYLAAQRFVADPMAERESQRQELLGRLEAKAGWPFRWWEPWMMDGSTLPETNIAPKNGGFQ